MRLDQATRIMLGDREVSRVYLGANLVWTSEFSPASLFAQGEPGVWYDPSDFSTMFQDSAGTVPVTAVEQPVGLMLDKSGRGNHAYQPTATSRPVLSARVNLLTKTEQFDDAYWFKPNSVLTAGQVAPNGTATAYKIEFLNNTGARINTTSQVAVSASTSYTLSVYAKAFGSSDVGKRTTLYVYDSGSASWKIAATITLTAEWVRYSGNITTASNTTRMYFVVGSETGVNDICSAVIWGADLRVANDGVNLPPYQRVNTATDYDTAGFPHYLRLDGVDDWLVTPTITPGIDKAQVFAGVRKLRGDTSVIADLGPGNTTGSFVLYNQAPAGFGFNSVGTGPPASAQVTTGFAHPITKVLTGVGDIAAPNAALRTDGSQIAQTSASQGTIGNYLAYPLYIGRRAGTSLPFNGHLYSLVLRFGSNLPIETIEQAEAWVNGKTGAY